MGVPSTIKGEQTNGRMESSIVAFPIPVDREDSVSANCLRSVDNRRRRLENQFYVGGTHPSGSKRKQHPGIIEKASGYLASLHLQP